MSCFEPVVEPEPDHDVHDDRGARDADHQGVHSRRPGWRIRSIASHPISSAMTHQRHGVGERGEHADAVVAEGHPVVRAPARDGQRVPAEAERRGVSQVVAGIGQQRETRSEPPGQRLEGHEREREYERGAQRPLGHPRGNVRLAVGAVVRVVVGH